MSERFNTGAIFREALLTSSEITNLVDTRIFVYQLPPIEEYDHTNPAVLLRRNGGNPIGRNPERSVMYRVESFGGSMDPMKADEVHDAVAEFLEDAQLIETDYGLFYGAEEQSGPSDVVDSLSYWPFITQNWMAHFRAP